MADFWLMVYILRLSGRPSSLHESNQPPLAPFDLDLIALQHLVEGGANVGTASSAFEDSQVDLGEVTVGPLPKVTSNMLQYLLHIHRTIPPVLGVFCADLSNTNVEEYLDSLTPHKAGWGRGRLGEEDRGPSPRRKRIDIVPHAPFISGANTDSAPQLYADLLR
jgi:hypothetical protein